MCFRVSHVMNLLFQCRRWESKCERLTASIEDLSTQLLASKASELSAIEQATSRQREIDMLQLQMEGLQRRLDAASTPTDLSSCR